MGKAAICFVIVLMIFLAAYLAGCGKRGRAAALAGVGRAHTDAVSVASYAANLSANGDSSLAVNGGGVRDPRLAPGADFALAALGDVPREAMSLSITEIDSGAAQSTGLSNSGGEAVEITVSAAGTHPLKYALFEVLYDAARFTPIEAEFTDYFGEETISLAVFSKPGRAGIGIAPPHYDKLAAFTAPGKIAIVRFTKNPDRRVSQALLPGSKYPERESAVGLTGIDADGVVAANPQDVVKLRWREVLVGDGDYSGEVGIPDITPIALNYNKSTSEFPAATVVDYDVNGDIGVPDVTPIALNYLNRITGYSVYYAPDAELSELYLIGSVVHPANATDAEKDALGYFTYEYEVNGAPPGQSWYFAVVPLGADGVEGPADPLLCPPVEVRTAGVGATYPVGLSVRVDNMWFDTPQKYRKTATGALLDDSGSPVSRIECSANETYSFELYGVDVMVWDGELERYTGIVEALPGGEHFDPVWETDVLMTLSGKTPEDCEMELTGEPGGAYEITSGPDDPMWAVLSVKPDPARAFNPAFPVKIVQDPRAPEIVAVVPKTLSVPWASAISDAPEFFCNMNDQPEGIFDYYYDYYMLMNPALDQWSDWYPAPPEYYLFKPQNNPEFPEFVLEGEFKVYAQGNQEYGTTHFVRFVPPRECDSGVWRFRITNNIGRMNSINHPPKDGTSSTIDGLFYTEYDFYQNDIRIYPETPGGERAAVLIYNENPRASAYPNCVDEDDPLTNSTWLRAPNDSTGGLVGELLGIFRTRRIPDSSGAYTLDWRPFVRVYNANVLIKHATGELKKYNDPQFMVATTLPSEADALGVMHVSDFGMRQWNCAAFDSSQLSAGLYWFGVFTNEYNYETIPYAFGTFLRVPEYSPTVQQPTILAIAHRDVFYDPEWPVFMGKGAHVRPNPMIEYPDENGVFIDFAVERNRPEKVKCVFIIAKNLLPDVEWKNGNVQHHDVSVVLCEDADGSPGPMVARILGGLTEPRQGVHVERIDIDIPDAPPPTPLPGIGDPEIEYVDPESGWIVFPLTAVPEGILHDGRWFVGLGNWDIAGQRWIDSPPFHIPFTVVNFEG